MLETRKVDNKKIRKALFGNLRPLDVLLEFFISNAYLFHATGTRYFKNIPEVQTCVS